MKLTKGQALELHWQMWTDMQTELGDNPSLRKREEFKERWCKKHFPGEHIEANCFLCEYCDECCDCPIKWDDDRYYDYCGGQHVTYESSPISVILALPVRGEENEQSY